MSKVNAQGISRFLRTRGYNPSSMHDSRRVWPALVCSTSGGGVRVRLWAKVEQPEPSAKDRETAAEIAALLTANGYQVDYEPGEYHLYINGKETSS